MTVDEPLSAREREILDVIYRLGEATASRVISEMKQPPSRSAVRTFLRILETKGHIHHRKEGREFVFRASRSPRRVGQRAVAHVLETFFGGSLSEAVASHLANTRQSIDAEELDKLAELINEVRKEEQQP